MKACSSGCWLAAVTHSLFEEVSGVRGLAKLPSFFYRWLIKWLCNVTLPFYILNKWLSKLSLTLTMYWKYFFILVICIYTHLMRDPKLHIHFLDNNYISVLNKHVYICVCIWINMYKHKYAYAAYMCTHIYICLWKSNFTYSLFPFLLILNISLQFWLIKTLPICIWPLRFNVYF